MLELPGFLYNLDCVETDPLRSKENMALGLSQQAALSDIACVAIISTHGELTDCSSAFCKTIGYEESDLLHRPFEEIVHHSDRSCFQGALKKALVHKTAFELRLRCHNGVVAWFDVSMRPALADHSTDGPVSSYYCMFHDISTRKAAEKRLLEGLGRCFGLCGASFGDFDPPSLYQDPETFLYRLNLVEESLKTGLENEKFRRIFEMSMDPVFIVSDGMVIQDCNEAAVKILKFNDKSEIAGKVDVASLTPEFQPDGTRSLDKLDEFRRPVFSGGSAIGEWWHYASDKSLIPVLVKVQCVQANGRSHFVTVWHDLTDTKEHEEALRKARDNAERANESKSEFLAKISHEIRTPMNGVIGVADLLLRTGLTDEQRSYLEVIRTSGDALLRIISDVLDISKIEAHSLQLESVPFDLRVAVAEAESTVRVLVLQKGIQLLVDVDPTVPSCIIGDPSRLRQVLLNLLSNAIKFTSRGHVKLRVTLGTSSEIPAAAAEPQAATAEPIALPAERGPASAEPVAVSAQQAAASAEAGAESAEPGAASAGLKAPLKESNRKRARCESRGEARATGARFEYEDGGAASSHDVGQLGSENDKARLESGPRSGACDCQPEEGASGKNGRVQARRERDGRAGGAGGGPSSEHGTAVLGLASGVAAEKTGPAAATAAAVAVGRGAAAAAAAAAGGGGAGGLNLAAADAAEAQHGDQAGSFSTEQQIQGPPQKHFPIEGPAARHAPVEGPPGKPRVVMVRFEVSDTGIGIPQQMLPKLFQPFMQADKSTSRRYGGTGLGLAICRSLVTLMGGTISASSLPGQGSCFSFALPFTLPPETSLEAPGATHTRDATRCREVGIGGSAGGKAGTGSGSGSGTGKVETPVLLGSPAPGNQPLSQLHPFSSTSSSSSSDPALVATHTNTTTTITAATTTRNPTVTNSIPTFTSTIAPTPVSASEGSHPSHSTWAPLSTSPETRTLHPPPVPTAPFTSKQPLLPPSRSPPVPTTSIGPLLPHTHLRSSPATRQGSFVIPHANPPGLSGSSSLGVAAGAAAIVPPGRAPSSSQSTAAPPTAELTSFAGLRCLVVEDNPVNRMVVVRLLGSLQVTCDVAEDGVKAVAACQEKDYDVIFMDVHMPEMDGYEATRRIRELSQVNGSTSPSPPCTSPSPPNASLEHGAVISSNSRYFFKPPSTTMNRPLITALTASALKHERDKCASIGMDAFLTKPVRVHDLEAVLRPYFSHGCRRA
ncbi:hypothetical protein CLOM_g22303 [Closterium sp. NIES-68]|nr:hypothetical protein CLOM_g22303 [Closterium sp. NIES-68]GJP64421.1 hypothetical protein CLOP_g21416 [Closterium sp. NIES-67]